MDENERLYFEWNIRIREYFIKNNFLKSNIKRLFITYEKNVLIENLVQDFIVIDNDVFKVPYSLLSSFNKLRKRGQHIKEIINHILPDVNFKFIISFTLSNVEYGYLRHTNDEFYNDNFKFIYKMNYNKDEYGRDVNLKELISLSEEDENNLWGDI